MSRCLLYECRVDNAVVVAAEDALFDAGTVSCVFLHGDVM